MCERMRSVVVATGTCCSRGDTSSYMANGQLLSDLDESPLQRYQYDCYYNQYQHLKCMKQSLQQYTFYSDADIKSYAWCTVSYGSLLQLIPSSDDHWKMKILQWHDVSLLLLLCMFVYRLSIISNWWMNRRCVKFWRLVVSCRTISQQNRFYADDQLSTNEKLSNELFLLQQ